MPASTAAWIDGPSASASGMLTTSPSGCEATAASIRSLIATMSNVSGAWYSTVTPMSSPAASTPLAATDQNGSEACPCVTTTKRKSRCVTPPSPFPSPSPLPSSPLLVHAVAARANTNASTANLFTIEPTPFSPGDPPGHPGTTSPSKSPPPPTPAPGTRGFASRAGAGQTPARARDRAPRRVRVRTKPPPRTPRRCGAPRERPRRRRRAAGRGRPARRRGSRGRPAATRSAIAASTSFRCTWITRRARGAGERDGIAATHHHVAGVEAQTHAGDIEQALDVLGSLHDRAVVRVHGHAQPVLAGRLAARSTPRPSAAHPAGSSRPAPS